MKKETMDNSVRKKRRKVFIILAIIVFVLLAGLLLFGIFHNRSSKKDLNELPGQTIYILDKKDLVKGDDGTYYSLARVIMTSVPDDKQSDSPYPPAYEGSVQYVILKKYGEFPSVLIYSSGSIETGPQNPYRVSEKLQVMDLSDIITEDNMENNSVTLAGLDGLSFSVIDMDNDIIMSAQEYQDKRDANIFGGIALILLLYVVLPVVVIIALIILVIKVAVNIFQRD